jgi:hypothetical protein
VSVWDASTGARVATWSADNRRHSSTRTVRTC